MFGTTPDWWVQRDRPLYSMGAGDWRLSVLSDHCTFWEDGFRARRGFRAPGIGTQEEAGRSRSYGLGGASSASLGMPCFSMR